MYITRVYKILPLYDKRDVHREGVHISRQVAKATNTFPCRDDANHNQRGHTNEHFPPLGTRRMNGSKKAEFAASSSSLRHVRKVLV